MDIEIESLAGPRVIRKAYIGAILACILVIAAGAILLKKQLQLSQLAHVAIDEDANQSLRANRVVVSSLQCRRYEKDIFLNLNDVLTRTDYIHKWTQSCEELHEDLEHLKAACLLQEEKQKVDGYAAAAERYRRHFLEVIDGIQKGKITRPEDANRAIKPFNDDVRTMIAETAVLADAKAAHTHQSGELLTQSVLFDVIAACLLAVVPSAVIVIWTVWLTREIVARSSKLAGLYHTLDSTAGEIKTLMGQIVKNGDYSVRAKNPNLVRCWETRNCGQTACPSYSRLDNFRCWEVRGTFCQCKVQGVFSETRRDCHKCNVYQAARRDSVSTLSETFNEMILLINDRHLRLDAANEWLSTVVNASADGIIAIDEQGTITLFNPAAGHIFGWKAEDMIGRSVDCLMPEEMREQHPQHLRGYFTTGMPRAAIGQTIELTGMRSDGTRFPLELSLSVGNPSGKRFALATIRGVTDRRRREAELRRAKEYAEETAARLRRLSQAVEQSPASIVITDPQGSIEYVNPGFVNTTGYTSEEAMGKNPRVLQSGIHPPEFYQQMWNHLLQKRVWRERICNRKKNGELYWEDATIAPVLDEHGAVTHFVAVKVDITARKRAETELKEALEQLQNTTSLQQAILDGAEYSIIATQTDGKVTVFNAGAERMLGYQAEDVVGKVTPEIIHDRNEVIERARALTADLGFPVQPNFEAFVAKTRLGQPDDAEWTYIRKDGTRFPVLLSVTPICDNTGDIIGFMGIAKDITERKRAEESLRLAKKQAEEASVAKSHFLANMSHELRTPLNGVIGMTELLRNTALDERQRQFVEACHSSGKSLLGLINDILDVSKIEAGKLELDEHEFDLDRVVEETVEAMGFQARKKGIHLFGHIAPQVCRRVRGDSVRLRQILVNMIGNAVKFTDAGEVTVRVEPVEEPTGHSAIRFDVFDTGIGISPNQIDRLFKSFAQADSSTNRKYGGTGLGLAISKSLVELMGGRIGLTSEVGKGSTFWFILPLKDVADRAGCRIATSTTLHHLRVLVVACPGTQQHLSEVLHAWRITVDTALGMEEARGKLHPATGASRPFDLVLVDEDTIAADRVGALVQDIHGSPTPQKTTLFFLGNPENGLSREQQKRLGIDHFLSKPVCQSALLGAINDHLVDVPANLNKAAVQRTTRLAGSRSALPSGTRALLAEDNHVNRMYAQEVLRQGGVECHAVENGLQAIQAVQGERFDLVLMDCQMPEMDGFEATRRIREMECGGQLAGHLPVIALTANAIKGDREHCLEAGMDNYIGKPFEPDALLEMMGRLLAAKEGQPAEKPPVEPGQTPLAADRPPPINRDALLARCMGNLEFAQSLLSDFEGDLPERVDQIAQRIDHDDARATAESAHALKGAAGTITAEPLRALAAEIEAAGKAGDVTQVASLVDQLRVEAQRCLRFIPDLKERMNAF